MDFSVLRIFMVSEEDTNAAETKFLLSLGTSKEQKHKMTCEGLFQEHKRSGPRGKGEVAWWSEAGGTEKIL